MSIVWNRRKFSWTSIIFRFHSRESTMPSLIDPSLWRFSRSKMIGTKNNFGYANKFVGITFLIIYNECNFSCTKLSRRMFESIYSHNWPHSGIMSHVLIAQMPLIIIELWKKYNSLLKCRANWHSINMISLSSWLIIKIDESVCLEENKV